MNVSRGVLIWLVRGSPLGAAVLLPSLALAAQAGGAAAGAAQGLTLDLTGGGQMSERLMQIADYYDAREEARTAAKRLIQKNCTAFTILQNRGIATVNAAGDE